MTDRPFSLQDLEPGDHLCCIYETEQEHRAVLTPFLTDGLHTGEKVLYIVDAHTAETVMKYLRDEGADADRYVAKGQFSILTSDAAYMQTGVFDPQGMISLLQAETEAALAEGYSALRVTGEMTWALRGLPGSERLIEYETLLNDFLPSSRCLAICQYDARRFTPDVLLNVLRTHPIAVVGTAIYDNFYYVSPAELLSDGQPTAELRHWIGNLAERKQGDEALRESEERYRHIFQRSPVGIDISSLDGRVTMANKAMQSITGYSADELLKINLADTYESRQAREALLEAISSDGAVHDYPVRLKRKDGSLYDALLSISPIKLGGTDFLHTVCEDVTERKKAEQLLERAKNEWETTFDAIRDWVCLVDPESRRVLRTNRAGVEIGGLPVDELIGQTCCKLLHGSEVPLPGCPVQKMLETHQRETIEIQVPETDRWFMIVADPVFDDNGDVAAVVHIARDTTDSKQAEQILRESKELFEKTFAAQRDAIFILDAQVPPRIVDCNPRAEEVFGYARGEMLGRTTGFLHVDESALRDFQALVYPAVEDVGFLFLTQFQMKRADGSIFPTEHSVVPLLGEQGERIGWVSVVRSLTERRRTERELEQRTEDLQLINSLNDAVNRGGDLQKVIELMSSELKRTLPCHGATLYLLSDDQEYLLIQNLTLLPTTAARIEKLIGTSIPEVRIRLKEGSQYRRILEDGDAKIINDAETIQRLMAECTENRLLKKLVGKVYSFLDTHSVICVPLMEDGEAIGLLDVSRSEPFSEADANRLKSIAPQLIGCLQRKRAEERLRYQADLLENVSDAIISTDIDFNIMSWNRAAETTYGWKADEVIGKPVHVVTKLEYPYDRMEEVVDRFSEEGYWRGEVIQQRKDGQAINVLASVSMLRNHAGDPVGAVAVNRDITERKRAEEALAEERDRAQGYLDVAGVMLLAIDADQRVTLVNQKGCEILGYEENEIIGKNWFDTFLPERLRDGVKAVFAELVAGEIESVEHFENPVLTSTGEERVIAWYNTIITDSEGNITGTLSSGEDITERKRAEQEIRQRNEELLALNAIAETLSKSLNLREILDSALKKVLEMLAVEAGGIYLVDETSRRLTLMAHHGVSEEFVSQVGELAVDEETIARATEMGKAGKLILATELLLKERTLLKAVTTAIGREKIRSYLQVIIRSRGAPAGLLVVASRDGRKFTAREEQLLSTIAHQIGLAIENVSLFEEQVNKVFQMDALRKTTLEIASQLDLNTVLRSIAGRAVQLLGGTGGGLYLYRPEADSLEWAVRVGEGLAPVGTTLQRGEGLSGKVWETGQPLIVDDYSHWEGRSRRYEAYRSEAVVGVPVHWQKKFLGVLNVLADAPHTFSPNDAELLSLFASQAAIAIENARLFAEQERRAREMAALYETSLDISGQLAVPDVLRSIMNRGVELLHTAGGAVWLYRPGEDELELAVDYGNPQTYVGGRMKVGEGVSGRVFATRQAMAVEDYRHWEGRSRKYDSDIIGGMLGVPLMWGQQAIGVLNVSEMEKPRQFTEEEVRLLSLFANQAAVAIQNARLHEEQERTAREMTALYETSLDISGRLALTDLLHSIMNRAVELLGASGAAVWLYRPEDEELEFVVEHGGPEIHVGGRMKLGEGLAGKVLQTGEAIAVEDYRQWDGRSQRLDSGVIAGMVGVPLMWGEQAMGVLEVDEVGRPRRFTEEEVRLLTLFASQAAVAIQNARLYQETRRREAQLAALHDVALEIASELELTVLLKTVAQGAIDLLGGPRGGLYLYRPEGQELETVVHLGSEHDYLGTTLRLGEGACGRAAQAGQPLVVVDYANWEGRSVKFEDEGNFNVLAVPIKHGDSLLGALYVDDPDLERRFDEADIRLATMFANQAAIAIENAQLLHAVAKHKENLQELSSRLIDAQEQERKRIAQELHDEMGQALTAMSINLSAIDKQLGAALDPETAQRLAETDSLITRTLEQMRELALDLRPSMLDDLGLLPALRWYVKRYENRTGILVGLEAVGLGVRLPEQIETVIYRVVQEALTNVARHARANRVDIRLQRRDSIVQALIEDDGSGFDPAEVADREAQGRGVGLVGMRERIAAIGGSLEVESHPGKGTRLAIELPLP